jgi:Regulator of chromosome condensation (RCC1) repeat
MRMRSRLPLALASAVLVACVACGAAPVPATSASSSGSGSGGGAESSSGGGGAAESPSRPPAGPPSQIDCGDFTTCALAAGEVRCWGRNKMGELGDGGGSDRHRSVPVPGVGKATQVRLASNFVCASTEDKKVKCWGSGRMANDGKKHDHARATEVASVSGANEIAASGVIACARADAGITCWGADEATIGAPPKGAWKQVATGFTHACALDASGAPACWGTGDWGPKGAFAKPGITGATQLVTGDRHACVVKDKKVLCWGQNDAGQLGMKPDAEAHKKPVEVPGVKTAVRIVTGEASTCAILGDGSAMCWGANAEGELGLGKRSSDERPAKMAVTDVADVCLATSHGCALTTSGKMFCWGANQHGQLGDGSTERRLGATAVAW